MNKPLAPLWQSWRSLRPAEAVVFVIAGLLTSAIDLTALLEYRVGEQLPQVLAHHLLLPQLSGLLLLLCWLPAARSPAAGWPRRRLLVLATLLGSALGIALSYALVWALPLPSICDLIRAGMGKPTCSQFSLLALVGNTLWVFMPSLMIITGLEIHAQRRRQHEAAQALLREHSQLRRHALGDRLAALQAQVEPDLLFDALVAIEEAYARGEPDASARLERLIRHLRVALPRLPRHQLMPPGGSAGATLDSEAELIASYLALRRDLNGQAPQFDPQLAHHGGRGMPPMLLLPLVQRALRLGRPAHCWLRVDRQVSLGFDSPGLCREDAELVALRERLAVLGGGLHCLISTEGRTEFVLELPA